MNQSEFTIRFNHGRVVATFDDKDTMDNWIKNSDLYQPFMYTIHGLGEVRNLEKYKDQLLSEKPTWMFIPGFNGRYSISIYAEIRDIQRNKTINPHMSGVKRRNYPQVTLYKKTKGVVSKHTKRVHSLMAITFLNHQYGNRSVVVDHIDNNPMNNHLNNLQIITNRENCIKNKKHK